MFLCLSTVRSVSLRATATSSKLRGVFTVFAHSISCPSQERVFLTFSEGCRQNALTLLFQHGMCAFKLCEGKQTNTRSFNVGRSIHAVLDKDIHNFFSNLCDHLVRVPGQGAVESLNVSVACGVFLALLRGRSGRP